ncbi:MAG: hypothetical protein B6U95_08820 [Thermofilum sp. ex4484_82]|nr:MAG: hypothetical protein B6U95_08820 [Thermofilum sp. ex4484_82]OYT36138.1 MAG: hypothetical protein B6U96_08825 [Archaeoglobales archaeon ex4484_92]
MEKNFIEEFNKEFKKMYFNYNKAVSENDYDTAIEIGEKILQGLIKISREYILSSSCRNLIF